MIYYLKQVTLFNSHFTYPKVLKNVKHVDDHLAQSIKNGHTQIFFCFYYKR